MSESRAHEVILNGPKKVQSRKCCAETNYVHGWVSRKRRDIKVEKFLKMKTCSVPLDIADTKKLDTISNWLSGITKMKSLLFVCFLSFGLSPTKLFAESRYTIVNHTLIFNMRISEPGYDFDGGLDLYDRDEVFGYFFDNPAVTTLRVTGPGGDLTTASAIAEYLIRHNINTEAFGICDSACAQIFLGGKTRSLAPNAKLGFHRPSLVKEREKQFYEENRVKKGWKDRYDYSLDTYDEAIVQMLEGINYMLSRGVDIDFILKKYSTDSNDIWYPSKEELLEARVLAK
ncbi:Uncharacterised protein [marine metagenome]